MRRRRSNYLRQFYREVDSGPRRTIWPTLGMTLLFALVGTAVWWLGWSPAWRVNHVVVRGVDEAEAARLSSAFGLVGQNIFRLRTGKISRQITSEPSVASYELIRQLPHQIIINLKARAPALVWSTAGQVWLTDQTGRVFQATSQADQSELPLVVDTANIAVSLNQTVVPVSFMRTLAVLSERLPALYGQAVKKYEIGETIFDLDAVMADDRRARFNILGDVGAQLDDLQRLAVQRPDLFSRSMIDLRVDRWAYVK